MKIFSLSPLLLSSLISASPACKCLYGDPCWPSDSEFAKLASQLSQPLIHPTPPEAACYPASAPSGNCSAVISGTQDGNFRSGQPGSMQNINFETFIYPNGTISACYLDTSLGVPCEQGRVSPIGVDARSVQDIQATVKFAAKHNLRLVVKSTGHDYLGRSAAKGSLLLWTHNMKTITYNEAFVPKGAPASEKYYGITLGAGVQWHEAYDAIQTHGRFLVGGLAAGGSVGAAGGWIQGGGHSAFSPQHGLGVDNAIQFNVVTASGQSLIVNSHTNSDLFWALRGGGGGTFAVLASVTYKSHPSTPLTGIFFNATLPNPEVAKDLYTKFILLNPSLADAHWGGYGFFTADSFFFFYVAPNISLANATDTITPFFNYAKNVSEVTTALTLPFDSFYTWYQEFFTSGAQVGTNAELISRLLSRETVETKASEVADLVIGAGTTVLWHLVCGGVASEIDPDSAALNPAWRKAAAHLVVGAGWEEGAPAAEIAAVEGALKAGLSQLEALDPGAGAYFNEASLYETNPQLTFFGSHYPRLAAIKRRVDPYDLFLVAEGVGSEKWDADLHCRL
ncbi:hypothetical protein C8J56DRAFT_767713 [Mycena floridula]|nr:hypothetical protein C8J56DRAFT_767713 [Mycena floridula]